MEALDPRIIVILVSLLVFVYIGWTHRTSESDVFHSAKRQAGIVRTISSMFTVVGAPHFAIFTSLAFIFGWSSVAFYLGAAVGLTILSFNTNKIRYYIESDAHSFTDIAAERLGPVGGYIMTWLGMLFTLGVVIAQLILGAQILSTISGLSYSLCIGLMTLTIILYLLWGGYQALLYTDVLQGMVMLFFTAALFWTISGQVEPSILFASEKFGLEVAVGGPLIPLLFIGGVFATIGAPEIWQRILTARDKGIASRALVSAGLLMLIWGTMVVGVGLAISVITPSVDPGQAFVSFITTQLPLWVTSLVAVLVLAAIISTADTEIFAATVISYKQALRILKKPPRAPLNITVSRVTIIVFSVFCGASALYLGDLMAAWGILLNIGYIAGPLALGIIFQRGGRTRLQQQLTFTLAASTSIGAFIMIAVTSGDYFSWWALVVILLAGAPIVFPGPNKSNAA